MAKRRFKRRAKRRGRGGGRKGSRGGSKRGTVSLGTSCPSSMTLNFKRVLNPAVIFGGDTYSSTLYNLNDPGTALYGGSPSDILYFTEFSSVFSRYLVLKVSVSCKLTNVNYGMAVCSDFLLVPTNNVSFAVSNATTFAAAAESRGAVRKMLGTTSSGNGTITLRASWSMGYLWGKEYYTNETYAGVSATPSAPGGPVTPLMFALCCCSSASMGDGVWSDIRISYRVKLYSPIVGATSVLRSVENNDLGDDDDCCDEADSLEKFLLEQRRADSTRVRIPTPIPLSFKERKRICSLEEKEFHFPIPVQKEKRDEKEKEVEGSYSPDEKKEKGRRNEEGKENSLEEKEKESSLEENERRRERVLKREKEKEEGEEEEEKEGRVTSSFGGKGKIPLYCPYCGGIVPCNAC